MCVETHLCRSHIVRCWSDLLPFAFGSEFTTVGANKDALSVAEKKGLKRDEDHILMMEESYMSISPLLI